MGREKAEYRDNLEDLLAYFAGRRLLTVSDVARYTGRSRCWVRDNLMPGMQDISAATLARRLCAP